LTGSIGEGREGGESYLCNHHMAIKGPLSVLFRWPCYVAANLGDDWSSECDVWYEVTVHYTVQYLKVSITSLGWNQERSSSSTRIENLGGEEILLAESRIGGK
jgi:hypothetical protein